MYVRTGILRHQDVRLMCHLRVSSRGLQVESVRRGLHRISTRAWSLANWPPPKLQQIPLHLGALNPLLVGPIRMPKRPLNDHAKIPSIEQDRKRQRATRKDGGPHLVFEIARTTIVPADGVPCLGSESWNSGRDHFTVPTPNDTVLAAPTGEKIWYLFLTWIQRIPIFPPLLVFSQSLTRCESVRMMCYKTLRRVSIEGNGGRQPEICRHWYVQAVGNPDSSVLSRMFTSTSFPHHHIHLFERHRSIEYVSDSLERIRVKLVERLKLLREA